MGWIKDAWHAGTHLAQNIEHSVVGTVKTAAIAVDHAVLEPVTKTVVVPLYKKAPNFLERRWEPSVRRAWTMRRPRST